MSSIRFGRGREYQIFRREDLRTRWDLRAAVDFLNGFRGDLTAMAGLRRQAPGNATDEQVIQSLARKLVSGELVVALPQRMGAVDLPGANQAAVAPVAPKKTKAAVEEIHDAPTFDNHHDGVAQASALLAAAAAGMPFCEECARLAAQQVPA